MVWRSLWSWALFVGMMLRFPESWLWQTWPIVDTIVHCANGSKKSCRIIRTTTQQKYNHAQYVNHLRGGASYRTLCTWFYVTTHQKRNHASVNNLRTYHMRNTATYHALCTWQYICSETREKIKPHTRVNHTCAYTQHVARGAYGIIHNSTINYNTHRV